MGAVAWQSTAAGQQHSMTAVFARFVGANASADCLASAQDIKHDACVLHG